MISLPPATGCSGLSVMAGFPQWHTTLFKGDPRFFGIQCAKTKALEKLWSRGNPWCCSRASRRQCAQMDADRLCPRCASMAPTLSSRTRAYAHTHLERVLMSTLHGALHAELRLPCTLTAMASLWFAFEHVPHLTQSSEASSLGASRRERALEQTSFNTPHATVCHIELCKPPSQRKRR